MGHHLGLEERPTFLCKLQPEQNMGSSRQKGVWLMGRKPAVSVTEASVPLHQTLSGLWFSCHRTHLGHRNFSQHWEHCVWGPGSLSALSSLFLSLAKVLTGSWSQSQENMGTNILLLPSGQEKPCHFSNVFPSQPFLFPES